MGKNNVPPVLVKIWGFKMKASQASGFLNISPTQVLWRWRRVKAGEMTQAEFETVGKLPHNGGGTKGKNDNEEWAALGGRTKKQRRMALARIPSATEFEKRLWGNV